MKALAAQRASEVAPTALEVTDLEDSLGEWMDEHDISGRQAARHNFMWLRSHGYRRRGAPGAATAMKSADFDPHIVRITVVFGNPYRHRQAGQARRQVHFRPILRDGFRSAGVFKIVHHIRVAATPRPL